MEPQQEHERLAQELLKLATEGASEEEIRAKAMELKQRITDTYLAFWRWLNLADTLVNAYAPDSSWPYGLLLPAAPGTPQATQQQAQSPRGARVLAMATAMVTDEKARTVTAKAIAERLQRDGETGSLKDLATSAGNILARSNDWRRVKPGEYEPAVMGV